MNDPIHELLYYQASLRNPYNPNVEMLQKILGREQKAKPDDGIKMFTNRHTISMSEVAHYHETIVDRIAYHVRIGRQMLCNTIAEHYGTLPHTIQYLAKISEPVPDSWMMMLHVDVAARTCTVNEIRVQYRHVFESPGFFMFDERQGASSKVYCKFCGDELVLDNVGACSACGGPPGW